MSVYELIQAANEVNLTEQRLHDVKELMTNIEREFDENTRKKMVDDSLLSKTYSL